MNTHNATFAIYRNKDEVKTAIRSFLKLGFKRSDLSAFQSNRFGNQDFSKSQTYQIRNGAIFGADIGALAGGIFMFINGNTIGTPWAMILLGILLGGIFGAAAGALVGLGVPSPAAKRYTQYLQSGGILLSVHSGNPHQVTQARTVMSATFGQDIQQMNELNTWDKVDLRDISLNKHRIESAFDMTALKPTSTPEVAPLITPEIKPTSSPETPQRVEPEINLEKPNAV